MNSAHNDNAYIEQPTSPTSLRLEAARARACSAEPGRDPKESARDLQIANAFDGLADNREYLEKARRIVLDANKETA